MPVTPFVAGPRGRDTETQAGFVEAVAARTQQMQPVGRHISKHLMTIKGMPMLALLVSHEGAPGDENVPYHSATLSPLTVLWTQGYSYNVKPGGTALPNGHQVFEAWKDSVRLSSTGVTIATTSLSSE